MTRLPLIVHTCMSLKQVFCVVCRVYVGFALFLSPATALLVEYITVQPPPTTIISPRPLYFHALLSSCV